ncbi:MAG: glycoside hydrolase family 15 protein [Dehalococcoidia bacterium]
MNETARFIPYPPIERHGVIGDRRTAALVAADGTISWFCLPDYGSAPVFASLLDVGRGGFWRLGPESLSFGDQQYRDEGAGLVTRWTTDDWDVELLDFMAWPQDRRPDGHDSHRAILRRLRCLRGRVTCAMHVEPRDCFDADATVMSTDSGATFRLGERTVRFWSSFPVWIGDGAAGATFDAREGDEFWAVLTFGEPAVPWTEAAARRALKETAGYWREWLRGLRYTGPRADRVRRSAMAVHLLSYAPAGSLVAAPTTSLPERIGGDRNYDYRFAWVRDASLSLAALSLVGDTRAACRYMDWLAGLGSSTDAPLQVVYRVDSGTDLTQHERRDLDGYRQSLPVRFGNHAFSQLQLDSLGYLADCAFIYLQQQGGEWREEYWTMLQRAADYAAANWRRPDSGIWELSTEQHCVSSKVMSWVTLERATKVANVLGRADESANWRPVMAEIHAEVMERGWSERLVAFRQRYEADALDTSTLLIPVMGFLPADHPRVQATVERIVERLTIDGFVHRFLAEDLPDEQPLPVGEFEGAFLPCTFWLATTYAVVGRSDDAEAILNAAEAICGGLGLFAEEVDVRTKTFLGNSPLLFAQVEYARAVLELAKSRPVDKARLMLGIAVKQVSRLLGLNKQSAVKDGPAAHSGGR